MPRKRTEPPAALDYIPANLPPLPPRQRRRRGTGSLYCRASDNLWIGEVTIAGKRHIVSSPDRLEAEWRLDFLIDRGHAPARRSQDPFKLLAHYQHTVASWAKVWISIAGVRPSTARHYAADMENHVLPLIGHFPLAAVDAFAVTHVMFQVRDKGLSDSSRRNIRNEMSAMFELAVRQGEIPKNPARTFQVSSSQVRAADVPVDPALATKILDAVRGSSVEDITILAYYTGARQGELLSLSWDRVIWSRSTIEVRRTLTKDVEGHVVVGEPKTRRSVRDIPLIAPALGVLTRRWEAQGQPRRGWVFPGRRPDRWMSGSWVTHEFEQRIAAAGLPKMTFHQLRHLSLSLMLAAGVELPVVSRLAGHANVAITAMIYSHVVGGRERQAVEALDLARWVPVGE